MSFRRVIRNIMVITAIIVTTPLWLPVRLFAPWSEKDGLFLACSQMISLVPGIVGILIRRGFYWMCLDEFAWDCSIEFGTWIAHRHVSIGRSVYIGGRCTLGMCRIGDFALVGSNVDIVAGRHTHCFDDCEKPICDQNEEYRQVSIGRNTWIGNSTVVLDDIGDNSIIGAGSVVVKPIPAMTVAAGNPCTMKKQRYAAIRPEEQPVSTP